MDYSSVDHKQTTFSKILDDINLPDYDSKNENLREFNFAQISCSNSNISRLAIDQIILESKTNIEEKSIPVKYFLIDFRSMILGNQVRLQLKDQGIKEELNVTKYDMHYMIYRITKKYGGYIESNTTLRAIIDYQYYSKSKKYFLREFFIFVMFFIIPFVLHLFVLTHQVAFMTALIC